MFAVVLILVCCIRSGLSSTGIVAERVRYIEAGGFERNVKHNSSNPKKLRTSATVPLPPYKGPENESVQASKNYSSRTASNSLKPQTFEEQIIQLCNKEVNLTVRFTVLENVPERGSGGIVCTGRDKDQGNKQVIIKKIWLAAKDKDERNEALLNEITVMKNFTHQDNVVDLFDVFLEKENCSVWLVMEYMTGGKLTNVIKANNLNNKLITEEIIGFICREVLKGVASLHANGYVHRDIKSANIFLGLDGSVKLGDLGSAVAIADIDCNALYPGSPNWIAQEVLMVDPSTTEPIGYDQKVDIWAVGATAFEMIGGTPPFSELSYWQVASWIGRNGITSQNIDSGVSDVFRNFLLKCFRPASTRPSATKLLQDPFIPKKRSADTLKTFIQLVEAAKERTLEAKKNLKK